jgi:hypothetical protein
MQEERVRATVTISPAGFISKDELKKWAKNLFKFTAPTLAVFFTQLAMGVDIKAAALVASLAFYGSAADFWSKYNSESITK